MKNIVVDVKLWGKKIGKLSWNEEWNTAIFDYEPAFRGSGIELAPLMMPLNSAGPYYFSSNKGECFKALPGLIADSLPDKFGTKLIDEWYKSNNYSGEPSPLDRLCYVGERGMGALEFFPSEDIGSDESSKIIYIDRLTDFAKQVLNDRESFRANIYNSDESAREILRIGTSAGGAKPKAIIAYNEKTKEVRSGQVKAPKGFGYWLLKFDGVEKDSKIRENPIGIGSIEYAYYLMAKDSGINISESQLLEDREYRHFMTRRFDRSEDGEKIHIQTLAAIAHFDRDLPHSYEQAFSVMRALNLSAEEQTEFYRRMVFNVVARNHDDHTKNHSFMMDKKGVWRLAPAYDLCYSYSTSSRWISSHQMSINGKREDFSLEDLYKVAEKNEISGYKEIINKIIDIVSNWKTYADKVGVRKEYKEEIYNNLILFKS